MDFQRVIIKWVEKKKSFKIGKKISQRKLYFFKKAAKKDILENLSNINAVKDSTIYVDLFQKKKIDIKYENKYNNINYNSKKYEFLNATNNNKYIYNDNCKNHNYILKIIFLNLKNITFLLGKNDLQIHRILCHKFKEELNSLYYESISKKDKKINNSTLKYITLENIINLFNYYIYIKIYYYDFLNTLLRYIFYNFEDIKNENNIYIIPYKLHINFLMSCVNLKIQINKILKKNKTKKSFISCYGNLFLNSSSYHYLQNCVITKDGSSSLHSLSHQYPRIVKIANYHNENRKTGQCETCVKYPLHKTAPYGFVDYFIKNNIKKKKYVHFFLIKKAYYKNLNHERYTIRKYKNSMKNCVDLINKCISICLNVNIEKKQVVDYVKILQKKYMTYETWKNTLSIDKFNQQIFDFLKKDISFFSMDDLIFIMKYFIKIEKNMHKKKKLKQLANYLSNSYLINNMHIKEERWNGKLNKNCHINNYNIKQIKDLISILAKCKYRYNENLLANISTYILENIHTISSKDLIQFVINMYIILKNTDSQFLYQIMNMYKPPKKLKRANNEINNIFFKIKRTNNQIAYRMLNKSKNSKNCRIKNEQNDDKYFRVFEKNVKIKKLLLFIKILTDNNIYINESWSEYFIYLIKKKFNIIINENLLGLLFHVLSHMQSRYIFSDFFFLNNINNKYNIYKNINLKTLPLFYDFPSLLQITFFLSFYMYNKYIFNVTKVLMFNILDIYIKSFQRKVDAHEGEDKTNVSMAGNGSTTQSVEPNNVEANGVEAKNAEAKNVEAKNVEENDVGAQSNCANNLEQLAISCDQNFFDKMREPNFYVHDLKIYEKKKNNKYMKKKEKKKKQALINKINKIDVNQIFTFEELKNYLFLQNHSISQETKITETISDSNNTPLNKEKDKYVKIINDNKSENYISKENISLIYYHKQMQSVFNDRLKTDQNKSCKNVNLLKYIYVDKKENENKSESFSNQLNKETTVYSHSYKSHDNDNSDHCENKNNNYFDQLLFSRSIIIIIYNFIFYFTNHSTISIHPSPLYQKIMLKKFSYNELKMLYEAYTLSSYYINLSINIEQVMNNNKNASSSKMHKNILSSLREMNLKREVISEFVVHPFKIDICIKN
ncbi:conserved Plasmodium protein, unknown function [Plasmodium yoelii]|uniref:Uncharacterized protein n=3 Tax=Plasmodium yoelii TaxID=5861 RepID=A0AAE9WK77_PLAYO|nr:conserved Plasmodium protein, unknown function [Plasmodium yoelii]WBY55061.1 hypothetical protein Py17XNL_000303703 [Plasmodium yoelii yoelii]VTZ72598.1 conserved Plasmodium protein, unknown function [Plasmodium yoelii]|eukprot:XP_728822.2 conserved Plasmodium protein, unknown function [Plasmodium yoelii]